MGKLKGGEYIAIESMEGVYGNSPFVDPAAGGVVCYGNGDMDRPIALIQLNVGYSKLGLGITTIPKKATPRLLSSPKKYTMLYLLLKSQAKNGGLSHLERVAAVAFAQRGMWTPENQCLTAANKLNRKTILQVEEEVFEVARKKAIFLTKYYSFGGCFFLFFSNIIILILIEYR